MSLLSSCCKTGKKCASGECYRECSSGEWCENKAKAFSRYLGRCKRMVKELFGGSLPVFVAATLNRAAFSIISLIVASGPAEIAVTFVYAFCFLQTLGILCIVKLDPSHSTFHYVVHVVTELTGFAWKEFVTIIMLKWLFEQRLVGAAIGAWLLVLCCAFLLVYFFNAALALYFKPEPRIFEGLRDFNTDAIALAIAFSFTLIIAAQIYPTESAGQLADSESEFAVEIEDDEHSYLGSSANWFLLYCVAITHFVAFCTWRLAPFINRERDGESDNVGFGEEEEGEGEGEDGLSGNDVIMSAHSSSNSKNSTSLAAAHAAALRASEEQNERFWKSIDSADPDSQISGSTVMSTSAGKLIRPKHSVVGGPSSTGRDDTFSCVNLCWSYVDNAVFAWDPNGYSKSSLAHLVNTSGGYIIGCAWYTIALLSLQNIFGNLESDRVYTTLIYAIFLTMTTVHFMERFEKKQTRTWEKRMVEEDDERVLRNMRSRYRRNTELVRVAGRLLCGWSWADFVTSIADVIITDTETAEMTKFHSSNWLSALVKTLVSVLIFAAGMYYTKRRHDEEAAAKHARGAAGRTQSASSNGLSLQDASREGGRQASLEADFEAAYDSENDDDDDDDKGVENVDGREGFRVPLLE